MIVLTFDLGTSATKAALWADERLLHIARSPLETHHPVPGWAEQDPETWWASVVAACAELRARQPDAFAAVTAVGFSAARQTFALFDEHLRPIGPGVLWSDHRAVEQAARIADPAEFRSETGVVLNGGTSAAKVAWVVEHRRKDFASARWVLAPRDFVFARLTGEVLTDETLASRTGWYSLAGGRIRGDAIASRLPEVVPPTAAVHSSSPKAQWREQLGLASAIEVVIGAGDRACEVLGVGASSVMPTVSWGTTANVSVPHPGPIETLPAFAQVSRAAALDAGSDGSRFLVEAGLSASGAALDWLATLTGRGAVELIEAAADVPPGALGAVALPWFNGARSPWWRADANAAFTGLTPAHGPAELARALVEAVALDVARSIEVIAPAATTLALAGGGAESALWRSVLAATSDRPLVRRRIDDAGSVGARLLVAAAVRDHTLDADVLNPPIEVEPPDSTLVARYQQVRRASDAVAAGLLRLTEP